MIPISKSRYFLALTLFALFLYPAATWAEGGEKSSHMERRKFCNNNPQAEQCVAMKAKRKEMRQNCKNNPEDEKCKKMFEHRQKRRDKMRSICRENPQDEKCLKFKARRKEKCAQNPKKCEKMRSQKRLLDSLN